MPAPRRTRRNRRRSGGGTWFNPKSWSIRRRFADKKGNYFGTMRNRLDSYFGPRARSSYRKNISKYFYPTKEDPDDPRKDDPRKEGSDDEFKT